MRFGVGLAILGVGVVGLGWFARSEYATHIQSLLTTDAHLIAERSVHGVQVEVEGRDIRVSGLADGPTEHAALMAQMNAVHGRRVVVDELTVLPVASPYELRVLWLEQAIEAQGYAPSLRAQEGLAALGADGLTVAAGAPDGQWGLAAGTAIVALRQLEEGQMAISGRRISMSGIARTPAEGEAVRAQLDTLPEGYQADIGLSYLDDGTPPNYTVHYAAMSGAWVDGKLPPEVSVQSIAAALGLQDMDSNATQGLLGEAGTVPAALSALAPWMPDVETLEMTVATDGIDVGVGFGAGADLDLLRTALNADLGGASVSVTQTAASVVDGAHRVNPVTGIQEIMQGGYWLPVPDFERSQEGCVMAVQNVMAANRIGYVTGSARLDARGRGAINALAGVIGPCLRDVGLRAEIGGHTDSTGSPEGNLALSLSRAQAVREALIARGVPAAGLTAEGYGATQPIDDNATEDGRAANRRTAVRWIQ